MEVEELQEVRVLSNLNNITTFEVTTNFRKTIWRIPYMIEHRERTYSCNNYEFYRYSIGIKDLCKINKISCWKYFKISHRDAM